MGKKLRVQDYTDPAVQAKMSDGAIARMILEGNKDEAGKAVMAGQVL